jgi:integrase
MATIKLPFINSYPDRHGKTRYYFRRRGFRRVSLPGQVGSPEFMAAYQDAAAEKIEVGKSRSAPGTIPVVLSAYYQSMAFTNLAPGTQKVRRGILEGFRAEHGTKRVFKLNRDHIEIIVADRVKNRGAGSGHNFLVAISSLLSYAVESRIIKENPAKGVAKVKQDKAGGTYCWSEEDVARFEAHYPIGTRERLALGLLIYTVQRRSDVIRLGPQYIRDGKIRVRQKKTGTVLTIPIHSALQKILDATPTTHMTFLVTQRGRPFAPTIFSNWFKTKIREVGLPEKACVHGLRKAGCRRLAEAGCSASVIQAISGHLSLREVERYCRDVNQEMLAEQGIAALENTKSRRTSRDITN